MRTFEKFPDSAICPICGTNKDSECFLAHIDNTGDGRIAEGQPIHTDCLKTDGYRINKEVGIIYLFTREEV